MFKKLYLPLGMVAVVILSLSMPVFGIAFKKLGLGNALIVAIFLVCGWETRVKELRFDRKFLVIFVSGAVISLICAPWLAVGLASLLRLPALPAVGLVVMAAVPPTLSSGVVMTETAEGNTFLSMTLTIGYNLLGVLTLPVMLVWCLSGGSEIDTNPLRMLLNLTWLVVLPFFVGFAGKKLIKKELPPWGGYIPSTCVLLLLFSFFSSSSGQLKSYPLDVLVLAGAGGLVMHCLLMAVMWYGGLFLKFPKADCKALIFTGASKTITIALTTLAILGADEGGAIVPCLVFYFIQMLIDSVLAGKMGLSTQKVRKVK